MFFQQSDYQKWNLKLDQWSQRCAVNRFELARVIWNAYIHRTINITNSLDDSVGLMRRWLFGHFTVYSLFLLVEHRTKLWKESFMYVAGVPPSETTVTGGLINRQQDLFETAQCCPELLVHSSNPQNWTAYTGSLTEPGLARTVEKIGWRRWLRV
jgi:hypothetical protein